MNARCLSKATYFGMIGLMMLMWSGCMPHQAEAVPSFAETAHPGGQGAALNTGMDAYDPRVLRITFRDASPAEPLAATPGTETQPDSVFAHRFPIGEPSQQPVSQETPAVMQTAPTAPAVPEPSSLVLLLSGVLGVVGCRYLRQRRSQSR